MDARLNVSAAALLLMAVIPADAQPQGRARGHARRDVPIRFQEMDKNNDRVIARSEWQGSEQSFRLHDWDGDGVLSGDEVRLDARRGRADRFVDLDRDRDGAIAINEWYRSRAAFDRRDLNRDGRITREEFRGSAIGTSGTPSPAYTAGYERGVQEGRAQAREDRVRNQGYDAEGQRELETADSGYDVRFGSKADYQAGYRAGWRSGYPEGWRQP
jgi:EF hand